MKSVIPMLVACLLVISACRPGAAQQFNGAGIPSTPSGDFGLFPGRGMDSLAREIETAEEAPGPMFKVPEWMKPKWPEMPKLGANRNPGGNKGWLNLPKPKWMSGESTLMGQNERPAGNFFAGAGEDIKRWKEKTGDSIRTANQNIREATSNAWQNLSNGIPKPGWMNPNGTSPAPQPPPRSADQSFGGQNLLR